MECIFISISINDYSSVLKAENDEEIYPLNKNIKAKVSAFAQSIYFHIEVFHHCSPLK